MNLQRSILFLSDRDFLTLPILRSMDAQEYKMYVMGPSSSAVKFSKYCAGYFACDGFGFENLEATVAESINAMCEKYAITAIIPLDLEMTVWIGKNAHRLSTPSLPVRSP